MKKLFTFLVISLFLASCSSDDDNGIDNTDYSKVVAGQWVKRNVEGGLYEEFKFNGDIIFYKEYYSGDNTFYSAEYNIDKDSIYVDFMKIAYKYKVQGSTLTLTSKGKTHELTKE